MLILTGKGGKFAAVCAFSLFWWQMGAGLYCMYSKLLYAPVLAAGMGCSHSGMSVHL
jgi:tight adherence protein B